MKTLWLYFLMLSILFAMETHAKDPGPSSSITIAGKDEPGIRIVVSGRIVAEDSVTPLEGITLKVYHTDAEGVYNKKGENSDKPRLYGRMVTLKDGFYEFTTIKPASYPGGSSPAHIHAMISGADYPEQWIDSFLFEGDPFIPEHEVKKYADDGSFSPILKMQKDEGGLVHCRRDIRLKR